MNQVLANIGWTDEARAAALAVRRAKAAARKSAASAAGGEKTDAGRAAADRAAAELKRAREQARRDVEHRRWKKHLEEVFTKQREQGGKDFIDFWYPRGHDGATEDPHYGQTSPEAPYGYVEGTDRPRREPLYDKNGRPIIPRPYEDYHVPWNPFRGLSRNDESLARDLAYVDQVDAAVKEWGPFGRKKEFMDRHPGATEADWEKQDEAQFKEWKREHPR